MVSIVNGSAETALGSRVGDPIRVAFPPTSKPSMASAEA
jgi:hypothetical protein